MFLSLCLLTPHYRAAPERGDTVNCPSLYIKHTMRTGQTHTLRTGKAVSKAVSRLSGAVVAMYFKCRIYLDGDG